MENDEDKDNVENDENIDMLTFAQVAKLLKLSRRTIHRFTLSEENPLPVSYITERSPRIKRADLVTWLNNRKIVKPSNLKEN